MNQDSVERCVKLRPPNAPKERDIFSHGHRLSHDAQPVRVETERQQGRAAAENKVTLAASRVVRREGDLSIGWHERCLAAA